MLADVMLAGLFGAPHPARTTTPAAPVSALEISGRVADGHAALDPAFDVVIPESELARPVETGATAVVSGFAGDGRRLFSIPVIANGPFHVYLPLAPNMQRALQRLTLQVGAASAEQRATGAPTESAEIIAPDDNSVIVAWDAHASPAIRISESPNGPALGFGAGTSTYEQVSLDTHARTLYIEFSDGVHSVVRAFAIFGR